MDAARPTPTDYPIRQKSAKGQPKPSTSIERTCQVCGASFLGLAFGKTGEAGRWNNWKWYCSQECFDNAQRPPEHHPACVTRYNRNASCNCRGPIYRMAE